MTRYTGFTMLKAMVFHSNQLSQQRSCGVRRPALGMREMKMEKCNRCQDSGWDTSLYRDPIYCDCEAGKSLEARNIQWTARNCAYNLADYQELSRKTYKDLEVESNLTYPVLGMLNEAGEFAGKFKKIFRDKGGAIDEETRLALRDELGDVLWYMTQICTNLGFSLDELAAANLEKVLSRLERGKIHGSGDNR
jgi:NTP pyrophosphatase (non-canonical NTP hydrolase)